jgi:hypothetical protein
MINKTYSEKLRDPRWQKKRLEVMQRDNFTCQLCDDKDTTLNVHHCYYDRGKNPWEYDIASLITLCENCHKSEEEERPHTLDLTKELSKFGWMQEHILAIAEIFCRESVKAKDVHAVRWFLQSGNNFEVIREKYLNRGNKNKSERVDNG